MKENTIRGKSGNVLITFTHLLPKSLGNQLKTLRNAVTTYQFSIIIIIIFNKVRIWSNNLLYYWLKTPDLMVGYVSVWNLSFTHSYVCALSHFLEATDLL